MGKSIRSKIKRKWRARRHEMANAPFQDKLQREATFRLQQRLKAEKDAEEKKTPSLLGIAKALNRGKVNVLEPSSSSKSSAMDTTHDDVQSVDATKTKTKDKLNVHNTGSHVREKKARHGVPIASKELVEKEVLKHREDKVKPFAFIERTWELPAPKAADVILPADELVPQRLVTDYDIDVAGIEGGEDDFASALVTDVRHKDMNQLRPSRMPRGKDRVRGKKMKRLKRVRKCQPY